MVPTQQSVVAGVAVAKRAPKVSIMLITYNHEKYIAQALESILMQETEYDYEINVIEDCSTDGTQDAVMRYVRQYPDIVKPHFNKKNIGYKVTQKNFYRGFKTLKGDYFAILEGDDYWSSPQKLQKQVSFLEANPDFAACAHNTVKVYEDGSKEPHRFLYWDKKPDGNIDDAIHLRTFFHTTGIMYRNVFKGVPPPWYRNKWSCDISVLISHMQFGAIRHFDEDMAVYRAHGSGRFSNMPVVEGWMFNIGGLRRYNAWLGYRYLKAFSWSIARYCHVLLTQSGKGEAAPLTTYQLAKYCAIWVLYRSLTVVLDFPGWVQRSAPRSFSRVIFLALSPFLWALGLLCKVSYRVVVALTPDAVKDAIRRLEESNEELRNLRSVYRDGRLFTVEGGQRFFEVARSTILRAWIGIKKRVATDSDRPDKT